VCPPSVGTELEDATKAAAEETRVGCAVAAKQQQATRDGKAQGGAAATGYVAQRARAAAVVANAVSLSAAADTPNARLALNRALAAEATLPAEQAAVSAVKGAGRAGVRAEWRASVRDVLDQEQSAKGALR